MSHTALLVVDVNDDYGEFTATRDTLVHQAVNGARPELVKTIVPQADPPFPEQVRHNAFYATPLNYLLTKRGTKRVILTGQVTEQCILYSALDAYVRPYEVIVPSDAVAHIGADLGRAALRMMAGDMRAEVMPAVDCLG